MDTQIPFLTVATIERDYADLEIHQPIDGSKVEAVVFKTPRLGRALRNYVIYQGTVLNSSTEHLELNLETIEEVDDLRRFPVAATGTIRLNTRDFNLIYWKPYNQITTREPAAQTERQAGPTSPIKTTMYNPISPVSAMEFGGKSRKSRKSKRRTKRRR